MKIEIEEKVKKDIEIKEGIYGLRELPSFYVYYCLKDNRIWRIVVDKVAPEYNNFSQRHMYASLYIEKKGTPIKDASLADIIDNPIENDILENSALTAIALREASFECDNLIKKGGKGKKEEKAYRFEKKHKEEDAELD